MNDAILEAANKIIARFPDVPNLKVEELLVIEPIVKIIEVKANDFFIKPGDDSLKVGIPLNGLTKTFYILDNDKEHISHFGLPGSFIGVYTDLLSHRPSSGFVQALEDTLILTMRYDELLKVTEKSLAWAHLLRKVAESRFLEKSEKDRFINLKSANERYEYFLENYPTLSERIPQNQIALFLNITPATLSRLKNKSGNYKK